MEKPRVLCVAYDAAPSRAFKKLVEYSERKTNLFFSVMLFDGKPDAYNLDVFIQLNKEKRHDLVLIGMSSQPRDVELMAVEYARTHRIPYGFYGDIPCAFNRPHFQEALKGAAFYMGVTPTEKEEAMFLQAQGHCKFYATGNPLRDDFVIPDLKEKRNQIRNEMGFNEKDNVILMPGNKEVVANIIRVKEFCDWLTRLKILQYTYVLFSPHPGDKACYAVDRRDMSEYQIYQTLMRYETKCEVNAFVLTGRTASSVLPGADMVVDCGSSLAIEAAYNRIPSITWMTDEDRQNLIASNGNSDLEVLANGCSIPGEGGARSALSMLGLGYNMQNLYKTKYIPNIERNYPLPEIPDSYASVKKMLHVIMDHLMTIRYLSH